jgi:alpha-tubulin suppressor-like RCC1 family protein
VLQAEAIAAAARPGVIVIPFNSETDTLAGLQLRIGLEDSPITTVGIVQDGTDSMAEYKIVDSQTAGLVADVEAQDPTLNSWSELKAFFTFLKNSKQTTTVDFISCLLWRNPGFAYAMDQLEKELSINFRASSDLTGTLAGANWIQESDDVDIRDIYFTEMILSYLGVLYAGPGVSLYSTSKSIDVTDLSHSLIWAGQPAYTWRTASTPTGSKVVVWDTDLASPVTDTSAVAVDISANVTCLASTSSSFAAITTNGKIVAWGSNEGATSISNANKDISSGCVKLFATNSAFAALRSDNKLFAWGSATGGGDASAIQSQLVDISWCASTLFSFAAVNTSGKVITWGSSTGGGDSSAVAAQLSSGVVGIANTQLAFAALKSDGSVVTWGNSSFGGNSSAVANDLSAGIVALTASDFAFAALNSDGKVITWGDATKGGDKTRNNSASALLDSDIRTIIGGSQAIAALTTSGRVICWGERNYGANFTDNVNYTNDLSAGIVNVFPGGQGFTAVNQAGRAIHWSVNLYNQSFQRPAGQIIRYETVQANVDSGVIKVAGTSGAMCAIKDNGTAVLWGTNFPYNRGGDISGGLSRLDNITEVAAGYNGYAAIRSDRSALSWGGDKPESQAEVVDALSSNVIAIVPSNYSYAALVSIVVEPPGAIAVGSISKTTDSITLNWTAPSGSPTGYEIIDLSASEAVVTQSANTSVSITALQPNRYYNLAVRGVNSGGAGPNAAFARILTWPESPIMKAVVSYTAGQIVITWDGNLYNGPQPSKWRLTYTPEGGSATTIDLSANVSSYTLTGVLSDTNYGIKMTTVNEENVESAFSTERIIRTAASVTSFLTNDLGNAGTFTAANAANNIRQIAASEGPQVRALPAGDYSHLANVLAPTSATALDNATLNVVVAENGGTVNLDSAAAGLLYLPGQPSETYTIVVDGQSAVISFGTLSPSGISVNGTPLSVGDVFTLGSYQYTLIGTGSAFLEGAPLIPTVPCFLGEAPVLTPLGYRRIDSLHAGDLVRTADGRDVAIQRVSRTRVEPSAGVNPYVIPRGQFGASQRLLISPRHRVAVSGRGLVEARFLGLKQFSVEAPFTYYNLELPCWRTDNLVVAGVEVESLAPVQRVRVSPANLRRMIAAQWKPSDGREALRSLLRACRFGPDGVDVLMMKTATH